MKALTKFELYKLFAQKSVLLGIAVSFAVTFYFLSQQVLPQDISHLYEPWEGQITQEDIQEVKQKEHQLAVKEEPSWWDFKERYVYQEILLLKEYEQDRSEIINAIEAETKEVNSGSYRYQKLQLHKELLQDINYQNFYYKLPAEQMVYFIGTGGFVLLGALILIGISPIYSEEAATGLYQQMLSSKNGRKTIVQAKLLATVLFVLILSIGIVLFDFLFWSTAYSSEGWSAILQTINNFETSPYPFTIGTYFIIKITYLFVAGCSFATFVTLISALSNNTIISFIISSFLLGLQAQLVTGFYELPFVVTTILDFSHARGMMVDTLFQTFKTYNIFGYPVLYPVVYLTVLSLATAVFIYFTYKVIQRKQF